MAEPVLLRRDAGAVAWLTLNRPEARNALSAALMAALEAELEAVGAQPGTHVVVIDAAGPAFCAGHDLREVSARAQEGEAALATLFAQCSRLMTRIVRSDKPVIACVHGIATAAGCQLVATCDLAVAGETARFATPGVDIGLFCSTPAVALARAIGRKPAMEMLLTGEPVGAARALALGLVSRVVPDAALQSATEALAQAIASKSPLTLAIGKRAFHRQVEQGLDEAYATASEAMTRNMLTRDAAEGVAAFLQKRPPAWRGE